MSKKNFKLDLNKKVISRLQAKEIKVGGVTAESNDQADICHYHLIHFKSDGPAECWWSISAEDYSKAHICD